jgi:hypothetical protein
MHIQSCQFTFLKNTIPYAYGTSVLEILPRRAWHFFTGNKPNQSDIHKRNMQWVQNNKSVIQAAINQKTTHTLIVKFPFQSITLKDAIIEGYISADKITITLNKHENVKRWNFNYLKSDLLREILLTTTVGSTKQILDLINIQNIHYQCAAILGLIKGLTKSLSDKVIYKKEVNGKSMFLKCAIDVFAELTTILFIQNTPMHSISPYYRPVIKSFIKGLFKYLIKHFLQLSFMLITSTELLLESFKAGFKGFLRAYFFSLIGAFIGPMVGSLIGAIIINIFFDQCSYSPTQHSRTLSKKNQSTPTVQNIRAAGPNCNIVLA